MRLALLAAALMGALAPAAPAAAQAPAPSPAPDYTQASAWLCRPGKMEICTTAMDARRIDASGITAEPFAPAADPKVDCFYVYPTVSRDPTPLSDLNPGATEEISTLKAQGARFAGRCRLFAPLYRQVTTAGLSTSMRGGGEIDWSPAYKDVVAAWRDYLARDNHGRGFILIGHSQGSIHLARLIAEEIEGKPVARQMVGAYLAGHPQVTVPVGSDVGGSFKSTRLCRSAGQTGCVVVWSSYDASALPENRLFERAPDPGLSSVCVNPAALAGGKGTLDAYLNKPREAPESEAPYVHDTLGFTAECVSDEKGSILAVTVTPGLPGAEVRQRLLTAVQSRSPAWGLHGLDVSLAEGNLLKLADSQIAAWLAANPR